MKLTVLADGYFLTWDVDDYEISEDGYLTLYKKTGPGGKAKQEVATFNTWTMICGGDVNLGEEKDE